MHDGCVPHADGCADGCFLHADVRADGCFSYAHRPRRSARDACPCVLGTWCGHTTPGARTSTTPPTTAVSDGVWARVIRSPRDRARRRHLRARCPAASSRAATPATPGTQAIGTVARCTTLLSDGGRAPPPLSRASAWKNWTRPRHCQQITHHPAVSSLPLESHTTHGVASPLITHHSAGASSPLNHTSPCRGLASP